MSNKERRLNGKINFYFAAQPPFVFFALFSSLRLQTLNTSNCGGSRLLPTPYSAQLLPLRVRNFANIHICSTVRLIHCSTLSARLRRAGWLSYSVSEPLKAGSLTSKYQRVASRKYSLFPPLCRGVVLPALSLSRASPEQCRRVTPRGRVEGPALSPEGSGSKGVVVVKLICAHRTSASSVESHNPDGHRDRFVTRSRGIAGAWGKRNRYSATTPENIDVSSTLKGATSTNHVTDQKVRNTL